MTRKLINWFLKNVLLGAIPLIAELTIRWAATPAENSFSSEKNIPELMFLVAMVNLGTADDVERASDILDDERDKDLKESLTNWHNLLMAGMVIASVIFGGYLVVDTLGTANKGFLPHILSVAWLITSLFFLLALGAEVFINRKNTPSKKA